MHARARTTHCDSDSVRCVSCTGYVPISYGYVHRHYRPHFDRGAGRAGLLPAMARVAVPAPDGGAADCFIRFVKERSFSADAAASASARWWGTQ